MNDFIKHDVMPPKAGELIDWITEQIQRHGEILLAFADDGVIWGRLLDGQLAIAPNAPPLRETTLQRVFVFGEECEVRLFRDEKGTWKTARVTDSEDWFSESQILWGTKSKAVSRDGFLQVSEFRIGISDQFLPVDGALDNDECVRLEIHHQVAYDVETGEARIALSRLAGLTIGKREMTK